MRNVLLAVIAVFVLVGSARAQCPGGICPVPGGFEGWGGYGQPYYAIPSYSPPVMPFGYSGCNGGNGGMVAGGYGTYGAPVYSYSPPSYSPGYAYSQPTYGRGIGVYAGVGLQRSFSRGGSPRVLEFRRPTGYAYSPGVTRYYTGGYLAGGPCPGGYCGR
jgi:hypothetical protein